MQSECAYKYNGIYNMSNDLLWYTNLEVQYVMHRWVMTPNDSGDVYLRCDLETSLGVQRCSFPVLPHAPGYHVIDPVAYDACVL